MYHSVQFCRPGSHEKFSVQFLENRTMYFVENHMIAKLQCCTIRWNMFYFFKLLIVILILNCSLSS